MKIYIYLILALLNMANAFAQRDPSDYFKLDVRYYTEDAEKYLGVSPEIKGEKMDKLGLAMQKYSRRFRYILLNKTEFQNRYERFYPDTIQINKLYTTSLRNNKLFMSYFNGLAQPFSNSKSTKLIYTKDELMGVAARFFYAEGMKKDSTINSYICINLNGLKKAFNKDYTLIEAFCFEAIFEQFKVDGQPNPFIQHFKTYINQASTLEKPKFKNETEYVEKVRQYCFAKMEKDSALQMAMLNYYNLNKDNLSFRLKM